MHELLEQAGQHLLLLLSIIGAAVALWKSYRTARERHVLLMLEQKAQIDLLKKIEHELHPDGNGGTSMFDVLADTRRVATANRGLIEEHIAAADRAFAANEAAHREIDRRIWEMHSNVTPQPQKMAERHKAMREDCDDAE